MVTLVPVQSSMIAAYGYDPQAQTLVVLFNSGKAYEYSKVPPAEFQGLEAAESKGSYMNANIIGIYPDKIFHGWKE